MTELETIGSAGPPPPIGFSDRDWPSVQPLPPRILIVDDLPMNVELLEHVLRSEGFRTLSAGNGAAAVAVSRASLPDLILLDVMMPEESGFETCARLKSDPLTSDIPVIFVSALNDVKNKVNGLRLGGVDYLSKPVHAEEVLARVRVHLHLRENSRAIAESNQARLAELRDAQCAILIRPADLPDASFAVHYHALEGAGGDFYDVLSPGPGVFGYFVADISGHGVTAAFLTAAIKALLRQYSGPLYSPEDTMRGIDSVMRHILGQEQYLTACYAEWNCSTGRLSVVSAGHPPMILIRASGEAQILEMDSNPLGLFSSLALQRRDLYVSPGDRFFLYTDGMIECSPGGRRQDGLGRLVHSCVHHREPPLAEAVATIAAEIQSGAARIQDDLLLMGVEIIR
jgi:sigma-B regulation protein RsbU (phosphoserine phosphatase)